MVGVRSHDYTYDIEKDIFPHIDYFKRCFDDGLSAYKALLYFHDYLEENGKNKKRNIGVAEIRGNEGGLYNIITGLKEGDELLCIKTQRSTSGIGFWSTEKYDAFEEGKIYKVHHITNWSGVMVAYVLDEDATLTWATPETFKFIEKK